MIELGKYLVTADRLNYILQEKYIGKKRVDGKITDEDKEIISGAKYFPKLETIIDYILNNEVKTALSKDDIHSLEDIKTLLSECKKEIAEKIEFNFGKIPNKFTET